jgi:hypothetical protein
MPNALQQVLIDAQNKLFVLEDQQAAAIAAAAEATAEADAAQKFANVTLPAQQFKERTDAAQAFFSAQGKQIAAITKAQELTGQVGNAQVDAAAALAATRQRPGVQEVV